MLIDFANVGSGVGEGGGGRGDRGRERTEPARLHGSELRGDVPEFHMSHGQVK